jgi:hypothetical protein
MSGGAENFSECDCVRCKNKPLVNAAQWNELTNEYYVQRIHKHERYGQAFCNKFGVHDPELFYSENIDEQIRIIKERYYNEEL